MAKAHGVIRGRQLSVRDTGAGHLRIEWDKNADVGESDAREALEAIAGASEGRTMPLLADIRGMHSLNRDARAVFAETRIVSRVGILVDSALSRTIGNFFIGLSRNRNFPTRVFTNEDEAIRWLTADDA